MRDMVEEPPIQRMCPCSSNASCPKDSETSSSTLIDDDSGEDISLWASATALDDVTWRTLEVEGREKPSLPVDGVPEVTGKFKDGPNCSSTGAI